MDNKHYLIVTGATKNRKTKEYEYKTQLSEPNIDTNGYYFIPPLDGTVEEIPLIIEKNNTKLLKKIGYDELIENYISKMYLTSRNHFNDFTTRIFKKYLNDSARSALVFEKTFPSILRMLVRRLRPNHFKKCDSLHAITGIAGEYMEEIIGDEDMQNNIDYKEEIGDMFWYVALYMRTHGILVSEVQYDTKTYSLNKSIGNLLEMNKKWLAYNKEYMLSDHSLFLNSIISHLIKMALMNGLTFSVVLFANILKLKERYPTKFTAKDAIERKDKR